MGQTISDMMSDTRKQKTGCGAPNIKAREGLREVWAEISGQLWGGTEFRAESLADETSSKVLRQKQARGALRPQDRRGWRLGSETGSQGGGRGRVRGCLGQHKGSGFGFKGGERSLASFK